MQDISNHICRSERQVFMENVLWIHETNIQNHVAGKFNQCQTCKVSNEKHLMSQHRFKLKNKMIQGVANDKPDQSDTSQDRVLKKPTLKHVMKTLLVHSPK